MPTYEYSCKSCGEHLEVVQSFKDDALTECPNCAGELRKVFGSIGIVFKGSGFYKNDSRTGHAASKAAAAGSGTGSEPAVSSSSGDVAKPTTKDGTTPAKTESSAAPAAAPSTAPSGTNTSSAAAAS
ncbi:MAG TPA: FmdB family zinc ribbon protein [Acidimicrobiales bacterium]|nr:FmdB family zinc ribbon protein [Acidimicrobiales bacterium]